MIEASVIVPFKDAERTLVACLRSLISQRHRSFEVVLVDNNSTDRSMQAVEAFCRGCLNGVDVRVFSEARPGASAARNRGAAAARGSFLAFTDADCIADPGWLNEILPHFADHSVGAVAGNIRGFTATGRIDLFHNLFTLQGRSSDETFNSFCLTSGGFPSANLVVRKTAFEQVGGFDEFLPVYGEDYDLCARLYEAGHRIKAISRGVVRHIHRRDLRSTWRQAFNFGQAHGMLLARHLPRHVIVEIGGNLFRSHCGPLSTWVDFSSADKKLGYILMLSGLHAGFLWLLPVFCAHLLRSIMQRARQHGRESSVAEAAAMAGALIFKSAAMTAGRLSGSVKYGVVCF